MSTAPRTSPAPAPVSLESHGGEPAPADLAPDLARAEALPAGALEHLWEVLGPSLAEPVPPGVEPLVVDFCARQRVPRDELARAVRAARFLVRGAIARGAPADSLARDVRALGGGDALANALRSGYETARAVLQREHLRAALADHGKVLLGVDWRLDTVAASRHGRGLRAPVVFLTLRVQDGERTERITVQALPETLAELRDLCDQLLGGDPAG